MSNNYHIQLQTDATRSLIKFINEHRGQSDINLEKCLSAIEQEDIEHFVKYAKMVKPHGMGGITDWFPPVVFSNETNEYVTTILHALVNHWCHMVSLSFPKNEP